MLVEFLRDCAEAQVGYRAYLGKIQPGKTQDYVEAHKSVWPELIEVMHQAGVKHESCFIFAEYVVVYVEADDIDVTIKKLADDPVNLKWDRFMEDILEPPVAGSLEFFPEMKEVFRL